MPIDKKYLDIFANVTSQAAISTLMLVGKKDKIAADKAALEETFNIKSSNFFSIITI